MSTLDTPHAFELGDRHLVYLPENQEDTFIHQPGFMMTAAEYLSIFKSTESLTCVDWDIHCLAVHPHLKARHPMQSFILSSCHWITDQVKHNIDR